jgi:hypothetical protein
MQGRCSIHSCLLVKRLLLHFAAQERAPPNMMGSRGGIGGSIVLGLASKLLNDSLKESLKQLFSIDS